jgi:hypothetical protein
MHYPTTDSLRRETSGAALLAQADPGVDKPVVTQSKADPLQLFSIEK